MFSKEEGNEGRTVPPCSANPGYGPAIADALIYYWHHGLTIAQSKTGVFAEEGPENHPPNFDMRDMPYDSECAFAGVHCTGLFLGDEVLSLGHTIRQLFA